MRWSYQYMYFECNYLFLWIWVTTFIFLTGIVQLLCWSATVVLIVPFFFWIVFQALFFYVFFISSNKNLFRFTLVHSLLNFFLEFFDFSRTVYLFAHSAESAVKKLI